MDFGELSHCRSVDGRRAPPCESPCFSCWSHRFEPVDPPHRLLISVRLGESLTKNMAKRAFNLPNMLTYGRILAVPLVVLCFFLEGRLQSSEFARWVGARSIFIVASITDYFDGYLARAWQQTSNIGRMLDPIADKLLVATCLLLLAADTDLAAASPAGRSGRRSSSFAAKSSVSGLREYLAALKVSVPVTQARQVEDGHPDDRHRGASRRPRARQDHLLLRRETGIVLLWVAAIVTLYTGYDYFRAGAKHIMDE